LVRQKFRKRDTFQGMLEERSKGAKLVPRTDVFDIFAEAIQNQEWYVHMQPVLDEITPLVTSDAFVKHAGNFVTKYWMDHIDIMSRRGWSANAKMTPGTIALRTVRHSVSKAILVLRLTTILLQPFAVFPALAYVQTRFGTRASLRVMAEMSKTFIRPSYAKALIESNSPIDTSYSASNGASNRG